MKTLRTLTRWITRGRYCKPPEFNPRLVEACELMDEIYHSFGVPNAPESDDLEKPAPESA